HLDRGPPGRGGALPEDRRDEPGRDGAVRRLRLLLVPPPVRRAGRRGRPARLDGAPRPPDAGLRVDRGGGGAVGRPAGLGRTTRALLPPHRGLTGGPDACRRPHRRTSSPPRRRRPLERVVLPRLVLARR